MKTTTKKMLTAEELDEKFDNGEDISEYLDSANAKVSFRVKIPALLCKTLIEKSKKENISLDELISKLLEKSLKL
ncbi:MAG: hypothetical protein KDK36_10325 [Leptospiraceae bacterium]|nr:hypothetical protein [Leptospiraceae bacterium]